MPQIHCEGQSCSALPNETLLDCLLRHGVGVPHSCKAGACQSCLVRATAGTVPPAAQQGLKDTLRAQGYLLACSCIPSDDLTVTLAGDSQRTPASIASIEPLNASVLRVRLATPEPFPYNSGQFVTLIRHDGLARSYSLASLPHETHLELHVRVIPGGIMSQWLKSQPEPAAPLQLQLQGPAGNCFYIPGKPEEPLLLTGAGTGLAPLYGIARDALLQGHTGDIWLFHGALNPAGLYLTHELLELERLHPNFHYVRSVLTDDGSPGIETGELLHCILRRFPKLAGWKAYICGDPALVNTLRKKLFLAGIASQSIYADAFLPSATPGTLSPTLC